jgi:hypothetical protein
VTDRIARRIAWGLRSLAIALSLVTAAFIASSFDAQLPDQVALDAVRADLLDAASATVQPAHASLWLREAR